MNDSPSVRLILMSMASFKLMPSKDGSSTCMLATQSTGYTHLGRNACEGSPKRTAVRRATNAAETTVGATVRQTNTIAGEKRLNGYDSRRGG